MDLFMSIVTQLCRITIKVENKRTQALKYLTGIRSSNTITDGIGKKSYPHFFVEYKSFFQHQRTGSQSFNKKGTSFNFNSLKE